MTKIYLHFGDLTLFVPVDLEGNVVVQQVVESFRKIAEKRGVGVPPVSNLCVKDSTGKTVVVSKKIGLVLSEEDTDLFLTSVQPMGESTSVTASMEDLALAPRIQQGGASMDELDESAAGIAANMEHPARKDVQAMVNQIMSKDTIKAASDEAKSLSQDVPVKTSMRPPVPGNMDGDELYKIASGLARGSFKVARLRCEALLKRSPDFSLARILMSKVYHATKKLDKAREVLDGLPKIYSKVPDVLEIRGRIALDQKRPEEALEQFNTLLGLLRGKDKTDIVVVDNQPIMRRSCIQVQKCRALLDLDRKAEAFSLLESTVSKQSDSDRNVEAMLLYAQCFRENGRLEDGIRTSFRAISLCQSSRMARQDASNLARLYPEETLTIGRETATSLANVKTRAAALGFLADVARERSGIKASLELYALSAALGPDDAALNLGYMHVVELELDLVRVLEIGRNFFNALEKSKKKSTPRLELAWRTCSAVLKDAIPWAKGTPDKDRVAKYAFSLARDDAGEPKQKPLQFVAKHPEIGALLAPKELPVVERHYEKEELESIGIMCLICKALFQCGPESMGFIAVIASHVDSLRVTSKPDLHLCNIRNEQAYFCTVAYILLYHEKILKNPMGYKRPEKKIYILGDSHTLSPSYQIVRVGPNREEYEIVPKLNTGVKAWHLRKESHFYPKYQHLKLIETIPKGSIVIACMCEIDCREGVIRASAKDDYETVEEAISKLIELYISILQDLKKKYKWNILVHPAPPVLNETRAVVYRFNQELQLNLDLRQQDLKWLDIFRQLVEPDANARPEAGGLALRKEYALDGTHLSPAYMVFLREAVQHALESPDAVDSTST